MGIVVDLARSSVTFKDPLLLYQALDFRNNQVEFDMHAFTIRFGIGFDPDPKRGIGGSPDDYEFWQIGIVQNVIYQRLVLHFEHGHSFQFDWDNPVLDVLPNTFSAPYFGDPVFSATRAGQRPVTRVAVSKDGYGELLSPVSRSGVSTNNLPDALDLWDQPAGGSRLKLKDNSMIHHMEKAIGFQSWLVAKSGTRMEILAHVPPFTLMFWLTTDTKGFEKTYSFDTPPYKYGIYGRDGLVKGKVATRVEQIGASPSIQPKLANNGRAPVLGGVLANDRAQHFMSNYGLNP